MAVGGLFVVTGGRDQTIRLFNRTHEVEFVTVTCAAFYLSFKKMSPPTNIFSRLAHSFTLNFNHPLQILVLDDEREKEREDELEKESILEKPELPALQTAESEKSVSDLRMHVPFI